MAANIVFAGIPVSQAKKALILIHGRGGTADNIISISKHFPIDDFAIIAPQAPENTWYPHSFMEVVASNEPSLSESLATIDAVVARLKHEGIRDTAIYFAGFSQGACLTLEYVATHAAHYGGVIAFTGGLIGKTLNEKRYTGTFDKTPILITTGNPDSHVPLVRVEQTSSILKGMGSELTLQVFDNKPHSISQQEIDLANRYIFK